jgi:Flp pilus assembly pilin Flp
MFSPVAVARLKLLANVRLGREDDGQDLLEYGLLCALIGIIALSAVSTVGNTINTVFWQVIGSTSY